MKTTIGFIFILFLMAAVVSSLSTGRLRRRVDDDDAPKRYCNGNLLKAIRSVCGGCDPLGKDDDGETLHVKCCTRRCTKKAIVKRCCSAKTREEEFF